MNAKPMHPTIAAARKAANMADEVTAQRRGALIASVAGRRKDMPAPVIDALERYESAEDAASFAREQISCAIEAALSPEEVADRRRLARISALVAAHIVGLELVSNQSDAWPWKVLTASFRLREVPNYAGDASATTAAEALLADDDSRQRYGEALRVLTGPGTFAIACAPPYARAVALLRSIGVNPDDDPPLTLA